LHFPLQIYKMNSGTAKSINIFLADDDNDDCLFFRDALEELAAETQLTIANNGAELMSLLNTTTQLPHAIFLDLNMPRKNGFECLKEIRETPRFKDIPVIIFSTSANMDSINKTYTLGANYYVRKPRTFDMLKEVIKTILSIDMPQQQSKERFLLR